MATNAELETKLKEKNVEIEGLKESLKISQGRVEELTNGPRANPVQETDIVDFKVTNGLYHGKKFYSSKVIHKDVTLKDYKIIKKEHGSKVYLVAREPVMDKEEK